MPNVEKLRETLEYIKAHPKEHDQGIWAGKGPCGTTRCMAGTVVHLSPDHEIIWPKFDPEFHEVGEQLEAEGCRNLRTGTERQISEVAAELLDLDEYQEDDLFYNSTDLRDLYMAANDMTDGAIEIPADVANADDY